MAQTFYIVVQIFGLDVLQCSSDLLQCGPDVFLQCGSHFFYSVVQMLFLQCGSDVFFTVWFRCFFLQCGQMFYSVVHIFAV